ncbi:MAG: CDP-archaeol synthase [Nitrosomonas sp. PRO4]|nr:CDP-archaeol synthase [Nitrosomonas sp. PRO4]
METLQLEMILLFWLIGVNGAPILVARFVGKQFDYPIDCHQVLFDGRPVLGPSKTFRGLISALVMSVLIGSIFAMPILTSLAFGALSMVGDMTSSFIKRRLGYRSSAMALGLDQIPESLFPLLGCKDLLGISNEQIFLIVVSFFCLELILSRILFWLKIRKTPY